jgi:hypothetical protein
VEIGLFVGAGGAVPLVGLSVTGLELGANVVGRPVGKPVHRILHIPSLH